MTPLLDQLTPTGGLDKTNPIIWARSLCDVAEEVLEHMCNSQSEDEAIHLATELEQEYRTTDAPITYMYSHTVSTTTCKNPKLADILVNEVDIVLNRRWSSAINDHTFVRNFLLHLGCQLPQKLRESITDKKRIVLMMMNTMFFRLDCTRFLLGLS